MQGGRALACRSSSANGDLIVRTDAKSDANAWLYSHAIATLALCESYGIRKTNRSKRMLNGPSISWCKARTHKRVDGDINLESIGHERYRMVHEALKSAELSGLIVPKETYAESLNGSMHRKQANSSAICIDTIATADTPATRHGRVATPVMTASGCSCFVSRMARTNPEMERGSDWLLENCLRKVRWRTLSEIRITGNYATQVVFHMGGARWKSWYENLYPMLIRTQLTMGSTQVPGNLTQNSRCLGTIWRSALRDHAQFAIVRSLLSTLADLRGHRRLNLTIAARMKR